MKPIKLLLIGLAILFYWAGPVLADYTLILKNGHTVNVEAYKEEGGMIIFSSYGGEISIAKEDVQSIIPAEGRVGRTDLPEVEYVPGETGVVAPDQETVARPSEVPPLATKEKFLTPEEIRAEERAKEEREYQRRVREITERIKAMRDRYTLAWTAGRGAGVCLVDCEEFIKANTARLKSIQKDIQREPPGPGELTLKTRSPFTGAPPVVTQYRSTKPPPRVRGPLPTYTAKERKLSDLRKKLRQLEEKRKMLIQEMRQKKFDSGYTHLE